MGLEGFWQATRVICSHPVWWSCERGWFEQLLCRPGWKADTSELWPPRHLSLLDGERVKVGDASSSLMRLTMVGSSAYLVMILLKSPSASPPPVVVVVPKSRSRTQSRVGGAPPRFVHVPRCSEDYRSFRHLRPWGHGSQLQLQQQRHSLTDLFSCPRSLQGCRTSSVTGRVKDLKRDLHRKFPRHPRYMFLSTG